MTSNIILEHLVEELLELELRGAAGALDAAGQRRWEELSRELFGVPEAIAEKRRYVRVQVSEAADLVDVSHQESPQTKRVYDKRVHGKRVHAEEGDAAEASAAGESTAAPERSPEGSTRVLSLSAGGLFLETDRLLKTGEEVEVALRVPHPEPLKLSLRGEVRWVSEQEGGRVGAGLRFIGLDETQRAAISSLVRDELLTDLRLAVEKSRFFFEASPDVTILVDRSGVLRECNARARRLLGVQPGDRIQDVVEGLTVGLEAIDRQAFEDALTAVAKGRSTSPQRFDLVLPATEGKRGEGARGKRGEIVLEVLVTSVHSTQIDLGLLLVGRDVTTRLALERQRQRLEERIRQTDKLATLGRIAAGIAHDINNPLAWIISNLEALGDYVVPLKHLVARALGREAPAVDAALLGEIDADLLTLVQETAEGSRRIRQITRDLHGFSRLDNERPEPLDVNGVLEATLRMLDKTLRQHATIVRDFGEIPLTESHFGKLSQIFLNLLTNAARAFDSTDMGRNVVMLRTRYDARTDTILVCIEDNGRGIPETLRQEIFEPLFTTHRDDGGTGLGLSIAQNAARDLGARLTLTSEEGKGSEFCLHLPRRAPTTTAAAIKEKAQASSERRPRLLIVDDEVLLLRSFERHLRRFFDVVTAAGVADAIASMKEHPPDFVLCDIMMPGGGGRAVYESALRLDETLGARFIFMTGGAFEHEASEFIKGQDNQVLSKPIDLNLIPELFNALMAREDPQEAPQEPLD